MSILILTDSRGFALQQAAHEFNMPAFGVRVDIWPYSGKTIEETVTCCLRDIGSNTYNIIYLCTGVNNLTIKHGSHNISPKYHAWSALVREIIIEMYSARRRLLPYAGRVIVCEMIGLHVFAYNFYQGDEYIQEQNLLNRGILRANEYIMEMNDNHGVVSPALCERVHKIRGPNWIAHRYISTLRDGLHFNRTTAKKILDRILINVTQMIV